MVSFGEGKKELYLMFDDKKRVVECVGMLFWEEIYFQQEINLISPFSFPLPLPSSQMPFNLIKLSNTLQCCNKKWVNGERLLRPVGQDIDVLLEVSVVVCKGDDFFFFTQIFSLQGNGKNVIF